jgi:hypothetical protein
LIDDATVAIGMAMILFFIPARSENAVSRTVMGVDVFRKIPWHIVLLFGGGFALAQGFRVTGLSELIGTRFAGLAGVPPYVMITLVCAGLTFLTELTSNTATTEMILPILASVAVAMKANPLLLMIPATLSASCAFMMPVATPPNAIIFHHLRQRPHQDRRNGQGGCRHQPDRRVGHRAGVLLPRGRRSRHRHRDLSGVGGGWIGVRSEGMSAARSGELETTANTLSGSRKTVHRVTRTVGWAS